MQWLEICAKDIFSKYKVLDQETPFNRAILRKALDDSAKAHESHRQSNSL